MSQAYASRPRGQGVIFGTLLDSYKLTEVVLDPYRKGLRARELDFHSSSRTAPLPQPWPESEAECRKLMHEGQ